MKWKLHRSFIFWAGLLVLAFIAWAWQDSGHMFSAAMRGEWRVSSSRSGIQIARLPFNDAILQADRSEAEFETPTPTFAPPFIVHGLGEEDGGIDSWLSESVEEKPDFRSELQFELKYLPVECWTLHAPYWLIMIAVALLWLLLLAWRWKSATRSPGSGAS